MSNDIDRPPLYWHFDNKAKELLAQHTTSASQRAPANVGSNRENFVNAFLKQVLPPKLKVRRGEILDHTGHRTGQLDTLIIRDDAPALGVGQADTYLAEGVFAVIEVKSNLTTGKRGKLAEAAQTLQAVEKLNVHKSNTGMRFGPLLGRPLRLVFAYKGATLDSLWKQTIENGWGDLFDLICILDRGALATPHRLLEWPDKIKAGVSPKISGRSRKTA